MSLDLFVFAGETSGDVHGAALLKRLREKHPYLKVAGVAGPKMREHGVDLFMPMENFQVMGYSAVFKSLFKLIYLFKKTERYILRENPKAVLFIDFPGFNLRMAKALRKKKFKNKLIHYICPTVWAHGKKRIYTLSDTLDALLSIFPFEHKYFESTPLKPTYIGHPLIEQASDKVYNPLWRKESKISEGKPLIGLFPGSRSHEIKQNLPKILKSCELFKKAHPSYAYVLSVAEPKLESKIKKCIRKSSFTLGKDLFLIPSEQNFQMMKDIEASIATSGTINFELAVLKVPTVVVYHLSKINAFIARHLIKLNMPYYCIVNIICKKHIFPELYYLDFIPEKVASSLSELCNKSSYLRRNCFRGCVEMLRIMNSENPPSVLAAEQISSLIHESI